MTETRITIDRNVSSPIEIEGFGYEHTPTESTCGGALLYISKKYNYIPRKDLIIYKSFHLESIFVEIIFPKKTNLIVGCIYSILACQ